MINNIPCRVHFVGIGGIGMSSLAQHLHKEGHVVTGSDRQQNEQTRKLQNMGIKVNVPHCSDIFNAQLVVRSSAVPMTNNEVQCALQSGVPVVLREELLGQIFDSYPVRIAVCGTHGKTTVTAMLHHVLSRCGADHCAFIGGDYNGENYFYGKNIVVAEACEYNRSFLHLHPTLCVCLNVEYDHPDCYPDLKSVQDSFTQLFGQSESVLICENYKQLSPKAETFGGEYINAQNVHVTNGRAQFDLFADGDFVCRVKLAVYGEHNVRNALAVLAAAQKLGLPLLQAAQALSSFHGADRRWSKVDSRLNVICDYAHHPTEIATTIKTAKSVCDGKVFAVFQPHTYSRTQAFFQKFVDCFDGVDEVIYLPVYSAREKPLKHITSFQLFKRAKLQGKNAKYFAGFSRCAAYLEKKFKPNDLIVLVGAGDINHLAELLK